MPIIILEGIDGSGKSTLATHIANQSPLPAYIEHRGPIKTNVIEEYITPLFNVRSDELLIADRWHLSEMIYGPLYRGKTQVDWDTLTEIETVLDKLGALRVMVQPSLDTVTSRLESRGEDFLKADDVPLVYAAYRGFSFMLNYLPVSSTGIVSAKALLGKALKS